MDMLVPDAVDSLRVQPADVAGMQEHRLLATLAGNDEFVQQLRALFTRFTGGGPQAERHQQAREAPVSNRYFHALP